ncbi:glycine--tRNA ligase subunit beta [Pleionea mediterranea]|uniref:Glycine--tRNA ligase beta subunit n=1 Tax=Pleionea mediterranea TaxID=523701 RepID=A0A316FBU0_9GAMM|nr:glycine--tRNA ligase subunit beta [Pleionea mediterranea]PWK46324.1 glycyl-tRNA synthetase beta chain [Pleionea mediterranea]
MSQVQDFLVELGTEELPPKILAKLAGAFHDNITAQLTDANLSFEDSEWFATPRRLAVRVCQLQTRQADKTMDRQGPAVAAAFDADGNPKPAAIGFAKSCGVDVSDLNRVATDKGERLAYQLNVPGQATTELLPAIVEQSLKKLPLPKVMRWGDSSVEFIRPPHWLLMMLGNQIVDANILDLTASNQTFGHRFHHPEAITINDTNDYEQLLLEAKVNVSFESRKATIRQQVEAIAEQQKAIAVIEDDLLEEVAALVEWPVALTGNFDKTFLQVPSEALIATMQADQKYFHLVDNNNQLLPQFITVSNIESRRPESVIAGNERVIRPRLADAMFFYQADCKKPLAGYIDKLQSILFQKKLGTLFDKTQRVKHLASEIAGQLNADKALAERAAELCKCDLMSGMVYEFPELQGIMGRYYATNDGEHADVAAAMDEVYMPRFAGDQLPETKTGIAIALADRLDTLVGIFGIGQAPSGAKDPFALRRAALGTLRIIVERELPLDLSQLIDTSIESFGDIIEQPTTKTQLLEFFAARSLAWYQDKGISTQVIQSVTELNISQPLDQDRRIHAVAEFNTMDAADSLAAANKRVSNILAKSEVSLDDLSVDQSLLTEQAEKTLHQDLSNMADDVAQHVSNADYTKALQQLSSLKMVIDNFFDNVMVNAEDPSVKNNRLALLKQLRDMFVSIADIALLQK